MKCNTFGSTSTYKHQGDHFTHYLHRGNNIPQFMEVSSKQAASKQQTASKQPVSQYQTPPESILPLPQPTTLNSRLHQLFTAF
jgi:hypothetical protein